LAVKKNDRSICDNLEKDKDLCKKIVDEEYKNYKLRKCDKLKYLKTKCEDQLNFEKRNCNKIQDELLKRQCKIMKVYDEAVKNHDKNLCNKLPRILKKNCFKKILTR
jgi:hypothetical protein